MPESASGTITVELACALPRRQWLLLLELPRGTRARGAVLGSTLPGECPEIDFGRCPLGIWGEPAPDDRLLETGDRVEVYRPLQRDPRDARRELAARGLTMSGRGR
ncbi:MAG: RnfH family protein [Chromatiales bacterium]|nr:RnfH family protein [Chromatiales bacterium]